MTPVGKYNKIIKKDVAKLHVCGEVP